MHLQSTRHARADIAQTVGVLCRHRATPTTAHWNEAIWVLRYIVSTREKVLFLGGDREELVGYVYADYAGAIDHRYSTSGFVLMVYGEAVVWGSKKQGSVASRPGLQHLLLLQRCCYSAAVTALLYR